MDGMDRTTTPYFVIIIGIIAASFAAILIKLAGEAPALIISVYRLLIATVVMTPFYLRKGLVSHKEIPPKIIVWNIVSGLVLALHFVGWISSLKITTVSRSVVLVSTSPMFVALFGRLFLKERLNRSIVIGLIVSITGITIMTAWETSLTGGNLSGDLLAILGAVCASVYWLIGRSLRQRISNTMYSYIAFATATVVLVIVVTLSGFSWTGYSQFTYLMFVLLAVVPQLIGHTSFNYALKYLPAVVVAIVVLGEPIGASILAFFILKESVNLGTLMGGVVVLTGMFLTVFGQERKQGSEAQ